ncbi:MAG: hypothetical protein IIA59_00700 [Candidatus Marinimicrobia bacterium]|nr:hypothetical protein [Candidatus Neomarinimicrobiota bacterium]
MLKLIRFVPGSRTYLLSVLALIMGLLLQADAQELFTLSPIVKMALAMGLTIVAPLIPIYLRKALPKDYR